MTSVNSAPSGAVTGPAAGLPVQRSIPPAGPQGAPPHVGRVKWFNDQKGFGFISDAENRDVFVHYAAIEGEGHKTLTEGETVRYDFVDGDKGRRATRVVRAENGDGPSSGAGE